MMPEWHHLDSSCTMSEQQESVKKKTLKSSSRSFLFSSGLQGGVLWYFHAYVGSDYFFGFKILSFNIFLGFQKNKYFFGYEDFVDIFLGSSQNWTIFRGHFYAFYGLFLRSRYRMGDIFWGC